MIITSRRRIQNDSPATSTIHSHSPYGRGGPATLATRLTYRTAESANADRYAVEGQPPVLSGRHQPALPSVSTSGWAPGHRGPPIRLAIIDPAAIDVFGPDTVSSNDRHGGSPS
jgi:hypothetical protein